MHEQWIMQRDTVKTIMATLLMCLWAGSVWAQTAQTRSQYQPGTILSVKPHHETGKTDPSVERFDVAVRVAGTVYTVLFTQPTGGLGIRHRAGLELMVQVNEKTMKFNFLGSSKEVPIIGREPAAQQVKH